ncbi:MULTISPECIES: ABC transporter substrate-binding protein [Actinomyces]|uniref:ABC transporter substrate-binding protein n=1 Tax=Actinomyces respiraculi TaxID=2744574 RepID=A0A7T0LMA6_9ACTO|nr:MULTISPECIES: ABC transporter substrate-binding protein [Actinomyces]QPL06379.1 ABC transporter substrate-binding protein [Actinomyces respiraculi]
MRTSRLRRAAAVGLCLALPAAVTACTHAEDWSAQPGTSASAQAQGYDVSGIQPQADIIAMLPEGALSDGVLDIGASTDYAPAEFLDSNGEAIGYEVDLDHAIAAVLGVTAEVHTAEFDSIIASIGSRYDIGVSAFTVTSERTASMDMISISNVGSRFYVAAGNPEGVDPSDHFNLCGLSIGVQTGTFQEEVLTKDSAACTTAGREAIKIRSYSSNSEATTALIGHTIDAVYSDSTVAGYAVELTGGQVDTVGEIEDALPQGIVLSKDDPQFTAAVLAAVQYLMGEGIWADILATWGVQDAALSTAVLNPVVEE